MGMLLDLDKIAKERYGLNYDELDWAAKRNNAGAWRI